MKTCPFISRRERASVLVLTLLLAGILVLTLGGFLYWIKTQNLLVAQSQAWNSALAAAEAGIEEGLAQINVRFGTNYAASAQANWGLCAEGHFGPRTGTVGDGSYSAVIVPASPGPTIISTGYVTAPVLSRPIKRVVRVTTVPATGVGALALAALREINANGYTLLVDSYDSANGSSTTNGVYDPGKRKAGGDVASTGGLLNAARVTIYGRLYTGPLGSIGLGAQGMVGDLPANWPAQSGLQPGWHRNDFNMNFPAVRPPDTTGWFNHLPTDKANSTNTYRLSDANYCLAGDLVIGNKETLRVSGNVTLWVQGNFKMTSLANSAIEILPGASLKLFLGTPDTAQPVAAKLTNIKMHKNANAWQFQLYGLPSTTSLTWNGNGTYTARLYAPEASVSLQGSADPNNPYPFLGSCAARSLALGGHLAFHYDENPNDENQKNRVAPRGFTVTAWSELPPEP